MSSATPLRDRVRSNASNDPNNEWQSPTTTPLRIAKKDSPQRGSGLARRQSSSYSHLKKNNLVTKSPFRSQIPTPLRPATIAPSPRRVSGEKRSRPISMHEQAENEHPLGFKRRQSKGFQGLLEKEPVTKSPFKLHPGDEGYQEPPSPPHPVTPRRLRKKAPVYDESESLLPPPPPPKNSLSPRASPRPAVSPARPSLVSKRLHGPRESGMFGRKTRRKTVTFDERCDVMEFSAEEDQDVDENQTDWMTDEDEEDRGRADDHENQQSREANESLDSSQAGDDSISGLVESMLQESDPHTPSYHSRFPDGIDNEDGVPYGRSHHAERVAAAHAAERVECEHREVDTPPAITYSGLSTPPHSRDTPPIGTVSPGSHMPLGRSTHSERQRAHKEQENAGVDEDIQMLPPSPSPAKRTGVFSVAHSNRDSLIPRFDLGVSKEDRQDLSDFISDIDPFSVPTAQDEPLLDEPSFMSAQLIDQSADDSLDPSNLSVGHSEVSLSGIDIGELDTRENTKERNGLPTMSTPPTSPPVRSHIAYLHKASSNQSLDNLIDLDSPPPAGSLRNSPRMGSPALGQSPRSGSPLLSRSGSPFVGSLAKSASQTSLNGSLNGRSPRISREDVHRRLLTKRSIESPLRESVDFFSHATPTEVPTTQHESSARALPRPLTRDNPTYDGVMSIDPEPQAIDPPRPSPVARAHSAESLVPQVTGKEAFEGLNMDFSTGFDLGDVGAGLDNGLGMSLRETPLGDMRSALDRLMEDVAGEASVGPVERYTMGMRIEEVTSGVQASQIPPRGTENDVLEQSHEVSVHDDVEMLDPPSQRPVTVRPSSPVQPPEPPVKDARRAREELIIKKKREARQREEEEDLGLRTPPRALGLGRPRRRRSRSTSDTEGGDRKGPDGKRRPISTNGGGGLLDDVPVEDEAPLADSIDRELRKLGTPSQKNKYHVRERSETIYASSDPKHAPGDADDNVWKPVRRPSDMNEYAKAIKAMRGQGGKAYGKIFVKVMSVKNLVVPIPDHPTKVSCTLNNGIHFVTTPDCLLQEGGSMEQEFELIETSNLEITLTLQVKRDPHIIAQIKANQPPPPPAPVVASAPPPSKGGGMRSFFLGSPKKPAKVAPARATPPPPARHSLQENLARYLTPDGALGRVFIRFDEMPTLGEGKLLECECALIGQRKEVGGSVTNMKIGDLQLHLFRIPPLHGILPDDLPQSLDECGRGLRALDWFTQVFIEGTLTQCGGDCISWRRRYFRAQGSELFAFSDVTNRVISKIDLRKAVSVEDHEDFVLSPGTSARRYSDEFQSPYGNERSFRIKFVNNEEIIFCADTDYDKAQWLNIMRALIGHIPPYPVWVQMVHQRAADLQKQRERAQVLAAQQAEAEARAAVGPSGR
ncbi:hypothetical protein BXZ70DRAFT_1009443 [Cristinia sonorae]|uniref:PH domain-containing protein n=1 Tax=Cristinia sonorae TaxID=1940300 RepID=A0A8K0ULG9_9AGAR|nr:hypothetical protein BXZ70DRAFT_1009443 [Cristinia sonorae]